jgi:hypothetical protein
VGVAGSNPAGVANFADYQLRPGTDCGTDTSNRILSRKPRLVENCITRLHLQPSLAANRWTNGACEHLVAVPHVVGR